MITNTNTHAESHSDSIAGKKRKQAIREAQDRFEQRKKKQRTRTALSQIGSVIANSQTTSSNQAYFQRLLKGF